MISRFNAAVGRLGPRQFAAIAMRKSAFHNTVLPIVIEQDGRIERQYDIYSRLLKSRIVCLMSPINDSVASAIVAQLLFLELENRNDPVHMYINSPGGSVTAGLAIYDTMQYIRAPIHTWCIGQAASMAAVLLAAGRPRCRFALPHSRIMIHQPHGSASGQASDIKIQAEEIIKLRRQLNDILARHSSQDIAVVEQATERDYFMSANEARQFGIIDSVMEIQQHA